MHGRRIHLAVVDFGPSVQLRVSVPYAAAISGAESLASRVAQSLQTWEFPRDIQHCSNVVSSLSQRFTCGIPLIAGYNVGIASIDGVAGEFVHGLAKINH